MGEAKEGKMIRIMSLASGRRPTKASAEPAWSNQRLAIARGRI